MRKFTEKQYKNENGWICYDLKKDIKDKGYWDMPFALYIIGSIEDRLEEQGFTWYDVGALSYYARRNIEETKAALTEEQNELLEWEESRDIKVKEVLHILENGIWVVVDTFYMRSYRYYYVSPEEIIIDLQNYEIFILETTKSEHWGEDDYMTKKTSLDIYEMGEKWFLTEEEVKKFTEEKYQEMMKQQEEKK